MSATRKASKDAAAAGITLTQIRETLGMDEDEQVGAHHVTIAAGILAPGEGPSVNMRAAMRTAKFAATKEPDWDRLDIRTHLEPIGTIRKGKVGTQIAGRQAIVRDDNGDILNIVSDRYKLVQHRDAVEPMQEALGQLGLPIRGVQTRTGLNGGFVKVEWLLDTVLPVRPSVGDVVGLSVFARSSYDYSAPFEVGLAALQLICANGMKLPTSIAASGGLHVGGLSVADCVLAVRQQLKELPEVQAALTDMTEQKVNRKQFEAWLEAQHRLSAAAATDILEQFDRSGKTLWDAHSAVTWYATHQVAERGDSDRAAVRSDTILEYAQRLPRALAA